MSEENINPEFAGPAFSVDEWRSVYRSNGATFTFVGARPSVTAVLPTYGGYPSSDKITVFFADDADGELDRWADDGGREPQGES